ncbi:MAG: hypothetical protein KDN19_11015 [Verrucomicrobiae bacterium]|nr:hypothetical protein [Verrucomicrobiae bacterium]
MSRSRPGSPRIVPLTGFFLLAALLLAGFIGVLRIRFESGEIYPHYSTQRSDPLGSKALYQSLDALPSVEVTRNLRSLMSIDHLGEDTALWLCGLSRPSFNSLRAPDDSPVMAAVKEDGCRLIITLNPQVVPEEFDLAEEGETDFEDWWDEREKARKKEDGKKKEDKGEKADGDEKSTGNDEEKEDEESEIEEALGRKLTELLAIEVGTPEHFERPGEGWSPKPGKGFKKLPRAEMPLWRSHLRFEELGPDWKTIALVEKQPVIVERRFGKGTIVLASDSYFASNEALWKKPHPEFLLWLIGDKPRLIFDETIHGTTETGSTMKVIRRYRLHGFFLGLAIFVGLLAWKSGASLTPGSEDLERGLIDENASVAGEDAASGLNRLLRRSVPSKNLLRTCLQVWRESPGQRHRAENEGQRAAIDQIVANHEADPKSLPVTEAFRRITQVLANPDQYRRTNRA